MTTDLLRLEAPWADVARHLAKAGAMLPMRANSTFRELDVEAPCSIQRVDLHGRIKVGAYTYAGRNTEIRDTTIGRFCSIARNVMIGANEHPTEYLSTHPIAFRGRSFSNDPYFADMVEKSGKSIAAFPQTTIGHDVWIADRAFIRRGVQVESGAIIAAGGVVNRRVAAYGIVGGVPAKLIRNRLSPELVDRLLRSGWWEFDLRGTTIDFSEPARAADILDELRQSRDPVWLQPRRFVAIRLKGPDCWALHEVTGGVENSDNLLAAFRPDGGDVAEE